MFDKFAFIFGRNLPKNEKSSTEKKKIPESKENMILDVLGYKDWSSQFEILDLVKEDYRFNIGLLNLDSHLIGKFIYLIDPNDDGTPRRMFYRITQGWIRRLNGSKFQELREEGLENFGFSPTPA